MDRDNYINRVLDMVADSYGLTVGRMIARSRKAELVTARETAIFILWTAQEHSFTLKEIGGLLGDRHYSTVIYGFRNAVRRFDNGGITRNIVQKIRVAIDG